VMPHIGNFGVKTITMKASHNVSIVTGSLIVFIKQLFDLMVLLVVLIPSSIFFVKIASLKISLTILLASPVIMCALLFICHNKVIDGIIAVHKKLYNILARVPLLRNKIFRDSALLDRVVCIRQETAVKLYFYSFLKVFGVILRYYVIAIAFNVNITLPGLILATPLVMAVTVIGFMPASLGTLEAGWFGVLMILGLGKPEIGTFVIGSRIFGEFALIIVTLICYLYYSISKMLQRPTVYKQY